MKRRTLRFGNGFNGQALLKTLSFYVPPASTAERDELPAGEPADEAATR